ncbi:hypothetical protein BGZ90_012673 [Linnemannia elongata]|nr:hypothetical protein BGZ90_012673 [Linnemannia elongata]
MTISHQRFRHGDIIESLAVRKDRITGEHYSRVIDIQETFPGATRFKVNGIVLNFLEDENEKRYEPRRIAHYPNDVIDIVLAVPMHMPSSFPISSAEKTGRIHSQAPQSPSTSSIDYAISSLSLQPTPTSLSGDLARLPGSANTMPASNPTLAGLTATPALNALGIPNFKEKVAQWDNTGSVQHQQLLTQIAQMMQHQNELLEKQNKMLQEQADAKKRNEKVLAEVKAAKEPDLETDRKQQQTIDRLIIAQRRVDAILVQNYKLHENSIPWLFVILPDSYESWDPRNFLKERFRLFFLCECGEECGQGINQGTIASEPAITTSNPPIATIRVKSRIHIAKHEGYELSRPTEFFDRYGPYVLGMLRILKHCLAVAAVSAPAVALTDNGIQDVMEGVKSISESTMQAVDVSINFLEQQRGDCSAPDNLAGTGSDEQDARDVLENLAALEGADLRRLHTFLRNSDKDKILGNLYRITTEQGHVKWVCFEHYKDSSHETALVSFVNSIEAAGGTYDPHFRRVTISLKSCTAAKKFFKRLTTHASAVDNLDVSLAWDFGSADLVNLVDKVAKSNIKSITLDLKDETSSNSAHATFRTGKGLCHPLLSLLANKNLRRLQLSNFHQFGTRTSNLPSSAVAPWIQSFHFHGVVNDEGRDRLANILSLCPNIVDLRFTGPRQIFQGNTMDSNLHLQIFNLKKLQRLYVTNWCTLWPETLEGYTWRDGMELRELVCTMGALEHSFVEESIRRSHEILEVLVLFDDYYVETPLDLSPKASAGFSDELYFSRLTHLDIQARFADGSLEFLSSIMPRLNLIHFGCGTYEGSLFRHINLASLKSLSVEVMRSVNFSQLREAIQRLGGDCQIEYLRAHGVEDVKKNLFEILKMLRLKRLLLSLVSAGEVVSIAQSVNLYNLQILSLIESDYSPEAGDVLARRRRTEFAESFEVQLDSRSWECYIDASIMSALRTRTHRASPPLPPGHRIQDSRDLGEQPFQFFQPTLPRYSY